MSGRAVLKITDGTPINTVDLLSPRFGYILCDWRPAAPMFEFINDKNWFSGIETPASASQKPHVEAMTFNARHNNVDELISDQQRLKRILHFAALYWTSNPSVTRPFYLMAKNKDETGLRYAAIFSSQLHDDSNPYAAPFFSSKPASTNLVLPITHGPWLDFPPGTGGLIMFDNVTSTLYSRFVFQAAGTHFIDDDARVFLSNSLSHVHINYMFHELSAENILLRPEDLGYELFDNPNTYTYFGMNIHPSTPRFAKKGWPGMWFNITTPAALGVDAPTPDWFEWEIYLETSPGVFAWTIVEVEDGTNGLTQPGTVILNDSKLNWAEGVVNTVNGLWVRVKKPIGIMTQTPAVTVKHVAATTLPYFDIFLAADEASELLDPSEFNDSPSDPVAMMDNPLWLGLTMTPNIITEEPFWVEFTALGNSVGAGAEHRIVGYAYDPVSDRSIFIGGAWSDKVSIKFDQEQGASIHHDATSVDGVHKESFHDVQWFDITETFKAILDFQVSDITPKVTETVTFTWDAWSYIDAPTKTIYSSFWDFGDGTSLQTNSSVVPNPTHIYDAVGFYTVGLTVFWEDTASPGEGVKSASVYKYACMEITDVVVAKMTVNTRRGFAPFNPGFDASESVASAGVQSYAWTFGDGTTGTGVAPEKVYDTQGVYSVQLTVTDINGDFDRLNYTNYIYIDGRLLYPGDNGVYLGLGLSPVITQWAESNQNKLYIGLKPLIEPASLSFQGFIPIYDDSSSRGGWYQPHSVRWNYSGSSEVVADPKSYTGYSLKVYHDVLDNGVEDRMFALYFTNDTYQRYRGTYRVFLRMSAGDDTFNRGDVYFSAGVSSISSSDDYANALNRTRRVTDALNSDYITLLDLGSVRLGGKEAVSQLLDVFWQPFVEPSNLIGIGNTIIIYDVILMPQDLWYSEISFPSHKFEYGENYEISMSSITPDGTLESKITIPDKGWLESIPIAIPNLPLDLIGKDVRVNVLAANYDWVNAKYVTSTPALRSDFDYYHEVSSVIKVNKYFGSRGKT